MKKFYCFFLFALSVFGVALFPKKSCGAESRIVDSLKNELSRAKDEHTSLVLLNDISREYKYERDYKNLKNFANDALTLADKLLNNKNAKSADNLRPKNLVLKPQDVADFKKVKAIALNNLGIVYWNESSYDEAEKNFLASLKTYEESGDKLGMGTEYKNLGNVNHDRGEFDMALQRYEIALKIYESIGEKAGAAGCYNNIANIYNGWGNTGKALENYMAALKISEQIANKPLIAACQCNIGIIYHKQGNFVEAAKRYLDALNIYEDMGDKKGMARASGNMGLIYIDQGNYAEALKYDEASLKVMTELGDKRGMGMSYENIGKVYEKQNKYDDALKYYHLSLKIREEIGDKIGVGSCYQSIGSIYNRQGKYDEAIKNLDASLKVREGTGEKEGIADVYQSMGEVFLSMGNYPEAIAMFNKAITAAKDLKYKSALRESYKNLSKAYQKTNDYKKAYDYFELYSAMKDSIFTEESTKQVAEMKTKYETEKKEKEIELLNKEKSIQELSLKDQLAEINEQKLLAEKKDNEIKIQNLELGNREDQLHEQTYLAESKTKEISLLNKDKEIQSVKIEKQQATVRYIIVGFLLLTVFAIISLRLYFQKRRASFMHQVSETKMKALRAQMNPHFIYNSLNSVYSYMQENDFKSASQYLVRFSKLIRLILENSLHNEVSLADELKALELFLSLEASRLNNKFVYEIHVADDIDAENTLIPPLLLEPFVENSIWHGFRDKEGLGKIKLNISRENGMMKCIIEDNGVGRQQVAQLKAIYENGKKESVGVRLTEERISVINQIIKSKAYVSITDLFDDMKKPAGVKVELSLPLQFNN